MPEYLQFSSRSEFRSWLQANSTSRGGVWLLFGKPGGPQTIRADEALEEALCFGWIDGQMQRIDDTAYIKYFSLRRKNSKWSDKNKALTEVLEKQGIMTDFGRAKIAEAKENGQWDAPKAQGITEEQTGTLADLLKEHEPAYTNYQAMSSSVQKTYTRAYFDAKTEDGRKKRLSWIIERLDKNLKPM
ncbi:MAG: YdeI/OmpD-associated family protein [Spirochaetaceae bacterium]|nr:YdeI/OmpD-associated family protein [Spirochaetaceae bacterium]